MNRWMKYTILFLVVFKISFSGILLNKDNRSPSTDSMLDVASAEEKREVALAEEKEETGSSEAFTRTFSEQEIAILTSLEKKRLELLEKEEELGIEEERLNKLKQGIEDRIAELKDIESNVEKLVQIREETEEKRLNHLAKVYEATPPEQAGPTMSKLDVKLAADVLMRINGRKAGKIWAFVAPQQAVKISEELARRKKQR